MSTVQEIERAVRDLAPEDLARFRAWFEEFDARRWDEQIARDAAAGRFDAMADEAIAEFRAGRARPL
jgi:hypothetical protein